jgi:hypothetical protein
MFALWDLLSNVESTIYRPYAESARSVVYNLWVSELSRAVGGYSSHVATLATLASLRLVSCWSPSLWDGRVAENCRCCEEWSLSSWQLLILSDPTSGLVRQYDFPVLLLCRKTSDTVFVAFVLPLSEPVRRFSSRSTDFGQQIAQVVLFLFLHVFLF